MPRFDLPIISTRLLAGSLVLALACAQPTPPPPPPPPPPPAAVDPAPPPPPTVPAGPDVGAIAARLQDGVDVSGYSGSVQWTELVSEGHSFAFVKATEGMDLKDATFDEHWRQMKEAGIIRGAYHFYVTEDDPAAQAQFFIDTVTLEPGDLAPVVDVETLGHGTQPGPGLADRLRVWLEKVEAHYGVKPIIYTTASFWNAHFTDDFGAYPLWVAEYEVETPRVPAGWSTWHLWQWQGDAQVPGVEKSADLSRVNHEEVDRSALVVVK